jgi:hypothetical protein
MAAPLPLLCYIHSLNAAFKHVAYFRYKSSPALVLILASFNSVGVEIIGWEG